MGEMGVLVRDARAASRRVEASVHQANGAIDWLKRLDEFFIEIAVVNRGLKSDTEGPLPSEYAGAAEGGGDDDDDDDLDGAREPIMNADEEKKAAEKRVAAFKAAEQERDARQANEIRARRALAVVALALNGPVQHLTEDGEPEPLALDKDSGRLAALQVLQFRFKQQNDVRLKSLKMKDLEEEAKKESRRQKMKQTQLQLKAQQEADKKSSLLADARIKDTRGAAAKESRDKAIAEREKRAERARAEAARQAALAAAEEKKKKSYLGRMRGKKKDESPTKSKIVVAAKKTPPPRKKK
jgi:colicin import membrane protein